MTGNINSAFGNLSKEREFADVTLACEDGKQVEAHKVILAASSPFFRNLLQKNKHSHPLIYMRGVESEILLGIIALRELHFYIYKELSSSIF